MAAKGSDKAPAAASVIEYFGFPENGLQTHDSFRLNQKAFADLLVRKAIARCDYYTDVPTPSGVALELFLKTSYNSLTGILGFFDLAIDNRLALRLVEDWSGFSGVSYSRI